MTPDFIYSLSKFGAFGYLFTYNQLDFSWVTYFISIFIAFNCNYCAWFYCTKIDDSYYHYADRHMKFLSFFTPLVFPLIGFVGLIAYFIFGAFTPCPYGRGIDPVVEQVIEEDMFKTNTSNCGFWWW